MAIDYFGQVWHNGEFIPWDKATLHVGSHVVSYASCIFEGIRCYDTAKGPAVFRLQEHTDRLFNSCRVFRMEPAFSHRQVFDATTELVRVNKAESCYIRPVVFRGYGDLSVNPLKNPIETYIFCWKWGEYMGHGSVHEGVDVCVSSWRRMAPDTLPAMSKNAANYMNSQLIKIEALANGYAEGIALDSGGYVSEASGANLFLVRDGQILTPPLASAVLPGITRNSIMTLAQELGYTVREQMIAREALYMAEEVFFTGTAAELTPIRSIDRIPVGSGKPGPVARRLQERFFEIVHGRAEDRYGWLTYCSQPVAAPAGAVR
ncbi:MAG TPA: branched-chain amino acid transaminase [Terriglobia bacterium]|nr:branched-chain amino acid transaminase [Terriglobia bacterium]